MVPGSSGANDSVGLSAKRCLFIGDCWVLLPQSQLLLLTAVQSATTPTCHYYRLVRNACVRRKQTEEFSNKPYTYFLARIIPMKSQTGWQSEHMNYGPIPHNSWLGGGLRYIGLPLEVNLSILTCLQVSAHNLPL